LKKLLRFFHALKLVRRPVAQLGHPRHLRRVRVEESTGTSNRTAAEEIRAKREAEILKTSIYGRIATISFAEAALSYLSRVVVGNFGR
jgi:hypothetical protein